MVRGEVEELGGMSFPPTPIEEITWFSGGTG